MLSYSKKNLGIILAFAAPTIWGMCFASNKAGLEYFHSGWQVFFLILSSLVFLTFVLPFRSYKNFNWRQLLIIGSVGILEPGLTYSFGQAGMVTTSAGISSLIISSEAIVTVLFLVILGIERMKFEFAIFALLSFVGVFLIVWYSGEEFNNASLRGTMLISMAVISASCYVILSAKTIADLDPVLAVYSQQVFGLITVGVILLFVQEPVNPNGISAIPLEHWINIFVAGIAQFSFAFIIFMFALKLVRTSTVAICNNIMPVVALFIGFGILGERMSAMQVLGAAITVLSLLVLSIRRAEPIEPEVTYV